MCNLSFVRCIAANFLRKYCKFQRKVSRNVYLQKVLHYRLSCDSGASVLMLLHIAFSLNVIFSFLVHLVLCQY